MWCGPIAATSTTNSQMALISMFNTLAYERSIHIVARTHRTPPVGDFLKIVNVQYCRWNYREIVLNIIIFKRAHRIDISSMCECHPAIINYSNDTKHFDQFSTLCNNQCSSIILFKNSHSLFSHRMSSMFAHVSFVYRRNPLFSQLECNYGFASIAKFCFAFYSQSSMVPSRCRACFIATVTDQIWKTANYGK